MAIVHWAAYIVAVWAQGQTVRKNCSLGKLVILAAHAGLQRLMRASESGSTTGVERVDSRNVACRIDRHVRDGPRCSWFTLVSERIQVLVGLAYITLAESVPWGTLNVTVKTF
jgi:hypothetical protein